VRTTINIPPDLMRIITKVKRAQPSSTTNGVLMDLARIGAERHFLGMCMDRIDSLPEGESNEAPGDSGVPMAADDHKKLQVYALQVLCIVRRFAHKTDQELLALAERDAQKMLQASTKS
jgi:hypothetical protein